MKQQHIGYSAIAGITLGIVLNAWITAGSAPVVYIAEAKEVLLVEQTVQIRTSIDWTPARIKQEVYEQAKKYNVSGDRMWATIGCENPDLIPELQSLIVAGGVREDSWGLVQIHLPSWPSVAKKQAQDPSFAIEWMAKRWSEGLQGRWSCYRKIYE